MLESYREMEPVVPKTAFVHERAFVSGEVSLGEDVIVLPSAVMRGDEGLLKIGDKTNIQDGAVCHCTAGVSTMTIGDRVTVGHGAIIHGAHVGSDCIIGMGSILLDNAVISPWTIVGAGALVPPGKEFPEGVLLVGSPAKVAREITDGEREWIESSCRAYLELLEQYREERR